MIFKFNELTLYPSNHDRHRKMLHVTHRTVLIDFPRDHVRIHWILKHESKQIHHCLVEHRDDTRQPRKQIIRNERFNR